MRKLRHHPHGETMMSYAAGTLNPAFSLVLSCHLHFCGACRQRLHTLDEVGGLFLESIAAADDDAFFERTMKRFAAEAARKLGSEAENAPLDPGDEVIMPAPLARITSLNRKIIPWHRVEPGLNRFDLPKLGGVGASAHILNIEPGAVLRADMHGGQLVLVLWGAYDFGGGHYERGDLHDISGSGFNTFKGASPEGATFLTAISAVPQIEIFRTAH